MTNYIHVYYDFEYSPSINMSLQEFNELKETDYEYWHVLCCTAFKVPVVYDYNELINYIGLEEKDLTDNILIDSIYELNSHVVDHIKFVQ